MKIHLSICNTFLFIQLLFGHFHQTFIYLPRMCFLLPPPNRSTCQNVHFEEFCKDVSFPNYNIRYFEIKVFVVFVFHVFVALYVLFCRCTENCAFLSKRCWIGSLGLGRSNLIGVIRKTKNVFMKLIVLWNKEKLRSTINKYIETFDINMNSHF